MQAPRAFLRSVAKAVFEATRKADGGILVDEASRFANFVWETWSRSGTADERRAEFQLLARAPAEAVRALANQAASEVSKEHTPEFRSRLEAYLASIPRRVR